MARKRLSDWYLIGSMYYNGQDELWNFEDTSGLVKVCPDYICGKEDFMEAMEELGWGNYVKDIIKALDKAHWKKITGREKFKILKAIDRYMEEWEEGIESNYYENRDEIVIYQLKL